MEHNGMDYWDFTSKCRVLSLNVWLCRAGSGAVLRSPGPGSCFGIRREGVYTTTDLRAVPGWSGAAIFTPLATGGSSNQRSRGAVADPPSSRLSSPPVSHRDATNSRAPWRNERSACTRHSSPNKPSDTTVSRPLRLWWERSCPVPLPPSASPARAAPGRR